MLENKYDELDDFFSNFSCNLVSNLDEDDLDQAKYHILGILVFSLIYTLIVDCLLKHG
jgi:hypothetical protein